MPRLLDGEGHTLSTGDLDTVARIGLGCIESHRRSGGEISSEIKLDEIAAAREEGEREARCVGHGNNVALKEPERKNILKPPPPHTRGGLEGHPSAPLSR